MPLTAGTGFDHQPAWSPDGRQIAFYSVRGETKAFEIVTADAEGGFAAGFAVRRLTSTPNDSSGRNNGRPAWSPDGRQIVFYSDRDGGTGIWIMNADGSGLVRLTDPGINATNPCWLPARR